MSPHIGNTMLRQLILSMLRRDDELRLSSDMQNLYAKERESYEWKLQVTENIQRQVVREHGFGLTIQTEDEGLAVLRSAKYFFPTDEEITQSAHYLRYNINRDCDVVLGEIAPHIPLRHLNMMATDFHSQLMRSEVSVVLAGSYT
jgi:hypothetical protein